MEEAIKNALVGFGTGVMGEGYRQIERSQIEEADLRRSENLAKQSAELRHQYGDSGYVDKQGMAISRDKLSTHQGDKIPMHDYQVSKQREVNKQAALDKVQNAYSASQSEAGLAMEKQVEGRLDKASARLIARKAAEQKVASTITTGKASKNAEIESTKAKLAAKKTAWNNFSDGDKEYWDKIANDLNERMDGTQPNVSGWSVFLDYDNIDSLQLNPEVDRLKVRIAEALLGRGIMPEEATPEDKKLVAERLNLTAPSSDASPAKVPETALKGRQVSPSPTTSDAELVKGAASRVAKWFKETDFLPGGVREQRNKNQAFIDKMKIQGE